MTQGFYFVTPPPLPTPTPNPDRGGGGATQTFCLCPWSSAHPVSGSRGTVTCDQMRWMLKAPTRGPRSCCGPTAGVAQQIGRCSVSCQSGRCVCPDGDAAAAAQGVSLVGCLRIRGPVLRLSCTIGLTGRERTGGPGGRNLLSCRCRSARPIILSMCDRRHLNRDRRREEEDG